MFRGLDEQFTSQGPGQTIWARLFRYAGVFLLTTVLFGGLYLGILFLG
jgi:hypothetical protein